MSRSVCSAATPLIAWLPTHGEVRHAHVPSPTSSTGEALDQCLVSGMALPDVGEESAVDLIDDLEVPRQQPAEQTDRPFLQRLGKERVVRIPQVRS